MCRIIPLTTAEIHLWLTFCDEITGEHQYSAYQELLNTAEKQQEQRFYFVRDRRRYLTTRALVRTVLSRYLSIHPKEWIFSTNAYGRPNIVNLPAQDACLSFNVSHTQGLIVLGVTKRRALGVDVENLCARGASREMAVRYFAPQEVAVLNAVPPHEQQYRFYEYWTFKEAYLKARGMGFSLPLDKVSFHYPNNDAVEMEIDPELADDSARWQFWQFRPAPEYLVAVCAERVGAHAPSLRLRKIVPMMSDQTIALKFLRTSGLDNSIRSRTPRLQ
jgi:4'-phosphopantetheinyl transferase